MAKFRNVLVVDDDLVSSYLTMNIIQEMNVAEYISTAGNGQEALNFLEANCQVEAAVEAFCPAFILLDLNMPVLNGFEFLDKFKAQFPFLAEQINIYILTTSASSKDIDKAAQYGIKGYIVKPITEENLTTILNELH